MQIVLGLIASQMPFFPDVQLDPELFLVLFIAPLLYLEAHEINKSQLLKSLKLSLSLAIGLAIFTMVVVGFSLHTLWPMFPLAAALALGAALGPTDAVAVSSLSHEATLTQRQIGVLKGESLFNDASGIVGFQFAIAAAVTGQFRVGEAAWEFLITFFGGAVFGCIVGVLANWVFESSRQLGWETTTTRILMELFLPFLLYLGAEARACLGHSLGGGRRSRDPFRPHRHRPERGPEQNRRLKRVVGALVLAQRRRVHSARHAARAPCARAGITRW